jgi:hypothetical protein|uniref:Uncharacterized protein n=1 Tax=viral metagenome TaxID=1070528 RepID=A0A6C0CUR1_9ZZZZ
MDVLIPVTKYELLALGQQVPPKKSILESIYDQVIAAAKKGQKRIGYDLNYHLKMQHMSACIIPSEEALAIFRKVCELFPEPINVTMTYSVSFVDNCQFNVSVTDRSCKCEILTDNIDLNKILFEFLVITIDFS